MAKASSWFASRGAVATDLFATCMAADVTNRRRKTMKNLRSSSLPGGRSRSSRAELSREGGTSQVLRQRREFRGVKSTPTIMASLRERMCLASGPGSVKQTCSMLWSLGFFHVHWPGSSVARSDAGQRPDPFQPGATPQVKGPRKTNPSANGAAQFQKSLSARCSFHIVPANYSAQFPGREYRLLPPSHGIEFHERYAWDGNGTRFQR